MGAKDEAQATMDDFYATNAYDDGEDWMRYPELGEDEDDPEGMDEELPEPVVRKTEEGQRFQIIKVDEEQRLVHGWASIIEHPDGTPIVDLQSDIIEEHELVKAAHNFMLKSRQIGRNHALTSNIGDVVDSLVVTKELKKVLGLPSTFPTGWFIGAKVKDDATWASVKAKTLQGFSIGGTGERHEVTKDSPGPSDVHTPVPLSGSRRLRRLRRRRKDLDL